MLVAILACFRGKNGCISPYFKNKDVTNEFNFASILMNLQNNEKIPQNYAENQDEIRDFSVKYKKGHNFGKQFLISTEQITTKAKEFCEKYHMAFDEKSTKQKLDIIATCDFFTANNDRHWCNILFLEKTINGKKTLELAPPFDNGLCFGHEDFDNFGANRLFSVWQAMGISENSRIESFENNKYFEKQKILACDIFETCKSNKKLKQIVDNCQNIDFEQLLNNFEKDYNLELSSIQKQVMTETFEFKRNYFNVATKKLEKRLLRQKNNKQTANTLCQ